MWMGLIHFTFIQHKSESGPYIIDVVTLTVRFYSQVVFQPIQIHENTRASNMSNVEQKINASVFIRYGGNKVVAIQHKHVRIVKNTSNVFANQQK